MSIQPKSMRPFIGAKDYKESRAFYLEVGFSEIVISKTLSYFGIGKFGFYLQDYYLKDWVDNSMLFMEVENVETHYAYVKGLDLEKKYPTVRLKPIVYNDWGAEFFLHDPSNILWHIGVFKEQQK